MQPFIVAAVGHDDAQHEIRIARHQIAFHHLRAFHHFGLKCPQVLILLPVQGDLHEDRCAAAQRRRADQRHIAFDHAFILQPFQAAMTGGWRQADMVGKVGHADPTVGLHLGQNLTINGVKVGWSHNPPQMPNFMHETSK